MVLLPHHQPPPGANSTLITNRTSKQREAHSLQNILPTFFVMPRNGQFPTCYHASPCKQKDTSLLLGKGGESRVRCPYLEAPAGLSPAARGHMLWQHLGMVVQTTSQAQKKG